MREQGIAHLLLPEGLDFLCLGIKLSLQTLQIVLGVLCRSLSSLDLRAEFRHVVDTLVELIGQLLKLLLDFFQARLVILDRPVELDRVLLGLGLSDFGLGDFVIGEVDVKSDAFDFRLLGQELRTTDL